MIAQAESGIAYLANLDKRKLIDEWIGCDSEGVKPLPQVPPRATFAFGDEVLVRSQNWNSRVEMINLSTMEKITIQLIIKEKEVGWLAWDINGYWCGQSIEEADMAIVTEGKKLLDPKIMLRKDLVQRFFSKNQIR